MPSDPSRYFPCPGPIDKNGNHSTPCGTLIPRRLVCSGYFTPEHEGLEYQIHKRCGFYNWLTPPAVPDTFEEATHQHARRPLPIRRAEPPTELTTDEPVTPILMTPPIHLDMSSFMPLGMCHPGEPDWSGLPENWDTVDWQNFDFFTPDANEHIPLPSNHPPSTAIPYAFPQPSGWSPQDVEPDFSSNAYLPSTPNHSHAPPSPEPPLPMSPSPPAEPPISPALPSKSTVIPFIHSKGKHPRCTGPNNCQHLATSAKCDNTMCPNCCPNYGKLPCLHKEKARAKLGRRTLDPRDPKDLTRPAPKYAYDTPVDSADAPPTNFPAASQPPKVLRKHRDHDLRADYRGRHEARDARLAAAEAAVTASKQFDHQIRIVFWGAVGQQPQVIRIQGISGWPFLKLGQHLGFFEESVGLAPDEPFEIYDFAFKMFTQEHRDVTIKVDVLPALLIRRAGIDDEDCIQRQQFIDAALDQGPRTKPHSTSRPPPSHSKKRAREPDSDDDAFVEVTPSKKRAKSCLSDTFTSDDNDLTPRAHHSRQLLCSPSLSPSPSPSSFPLSKPLPPSPSSPDFDSCWAEGYVHLEVKGSTWATKIPTRDMVQALFMMERASAYRNTANAFETVFRGLSYTSASKMALSRQRQVWDKASPAQRSEARSIPRAGHPLSSWGAWRKHIK